MIKQAPLPPSIIPKSFATPSLLSQIITSQYQYALPSYRQESMFKQYGIALSRQTMSSWSLKCAEILKPLYQHLHRILLQQRVIHADETTVNVLASKNQRATCGCIVQAPIRLRILINQLQYRTLYFMIIIPAEQAPARLNFYKATRAIYKLMATKAMRQLKRH